MAFDTGNCLLRHGPFDPKLFGLGHILGLDLGNQRSGRHKAG
jgi:hypothetical protein